MKQQFYDHFNIANGINDIPDELIDTPEYIKNVQNTAIDINHAPQSIQEIKGVVKTLKNGKASPNVPAVFFKYTSDAIELLTEVHRLLSRIWETRTGKHEWTHFKLVDLTQKHTQDYKLAQCFAKYWLPPF